MKECNIRHASAITFKAAAQSVMIAIQVMVTIIIWAFHQSMYKSRGTPQCVHNGATLPCKEYPYAKGMQSTLKPPKGLSHPHR